jgi:chromosome segregation ATPase
MSPDTINLLLSIAGGAITVIGGVYAVVSWIKARGAADAKAQEVLDDLSKADVAEAKVRSDADSAILSRLTEQAKEFDTRLNELANDVSKTSSALHRSVRDGDSKIMTPITGLSGEIERARKLVDDLRAWVENHVSKLYENLNKNASDASIRIQAHSERATAELAHLRTSVDVLSRGVTYLTESLKTQEQSVANLLADGAANEARLDALNAWRPNVEKQLLDLSKEVAGMSATVDAIQHRRH